MPTLKAVRPGTPAPADLDGDDASRRTQILEAANQCFTQLGIARCSVQDVARMAGVSRGTVYRYFEDRGVLIAAAIEYAAADYHRQAAAAMDKETSLSAQIGAIAEVLTKIQLEHRTRNRLMADDTELMRLLLADGDGALRRTRDFLLPYVRAARERGEVRRDLDLESASEWLARIIQSLSTAQATLSFDMSKPKTVRSFVETFAVTGLR